uniref:Uncharacterized protein n=1 Tax=viral metagenome TaxID=1070528 RepID=A0A6H2A684_9ZZZZ
MNKAKEGLEVITYSVTGAALAEMKGKYYGLKIVDAASYETVRVAIAECRTKRGDVESRRKELKAGALEYGRQVDGEAKRITGLIAEIEDPLKDEKQRIDDEKAQIKAVKEQKEEERKDKIRTRISQMKDFVAEVAFVNSDAIKGAMDFLKSQDITTEEYEEFTPEALRTRTETIEVLKKVLHERLNFEKEESQRKAEGERLAKERAEQEAKERALAEERHKIEEERAVLERAKRDADIREEARAQVEKEAREKVEREEKEAAEKARQESLRPDKEKLFAYAQALQDVPKPKVDSPQADSILDDAARDIRALMNRIMKRSEAL